MKTAKFKLTVEVREHPSSTADYPVWLAIVTTISGLCYFVTYAGDKPSDEKVLQAWREGRKAFGPYCGS